MLAQIANHYIYLLLYVVEYLDQLGKYGKKMYVSIGHWSYSEWLQILDCDGVNALIEANAIQAYTSIHSGFTGLIFRNLEPRVIHY